MSSLLEYNMVIWLIMSCGSSDVHLFWDFLTPLLLIGTCEQVIHMLGHSFKRTLKSWSSNGYGGSISKGALLGKIVVYHHLGKNHIKQDCYIAVAFGVRLKMNLATKAGKTFPPPLPSFVSLALTYYRIPRSVHHQITLVRVPGSSAPDVSITT